MATYIRFVHPVAVSASGRVHMKYVGTCPVRDTFIYVSNQPCDGDLCVGGERRPQHVECGNT